jgi:hypothetical protein
MGFLLVKGYAIACLAEGHRVFQSHFDRTLSLRFLIHPHAYTIFLFKNRASRKGHEMFILQRDDNHYFFCVNGWIKIRRYLSPKYNN